MEQKRTEYEDLIHVSEMKQVEKLVDNLFLGIDKVMARIEDSVDSGYSTKVNAVISSMIMGELNARLNFSVPDRYVEDITRFQTYYTEKVVDLMSEAAENIGTKLEREEEGINDFLEDLNEFVYEALKTLGK